MALAGGMRRHKEEKQGHPNESPKLPRTPPHTLLVRPLGGLPETETIWGTQTTGPTRLR